MLIRRRRGKRYEQDESRHAANEMAGAFLKFFYPIHYQFGKAIEDVMRDGKLTRKQVAILWLIHSEDIQERGIARKELQRAD